MHPLLAALAHNIDLPAAACLAAPLFLQHHGYAKIAEHSQAVAAECSEKYQNFFSHFPLSACSVGSLWAP